MGSAQYKYNAVDDEMTKWNKLFTSRFGDGTGDPEEPYLATLKVLSKCKSDSVTLDIGSGLGRIVEFLKPTSPQIIGLEPDRKRFEECHASHNNGYSIRIFNQTSRDYRAEHPSERFELVVVSMVIQHVMTDICECILEDVRELLSETGVAIISTTLQDRERFTYQNNCTPRSQQEFNQYASNCQSQEFGIPVRQFSIESFLAELSKAKLQVVHHGQFSYLRPDKVQWYANLLALDADAIREIGTSQFAVVCRD